MSSERRDYLSYSDKNPSYSENWTHTAAENGSYLSSVNGIQYENMSFSSLNPPLKNDSNGIQHGDMSYNSSMNPPVKNDPYLSSSNGIQYGDLSYSSINPPGKMDSYLSSTNDISYNDTSYTCIQDSVKYLSSSPQRRCNNTVPRKSSCSPISSRHILPSSPNSSHHAFNSSPNSPHHAFTSSPSSPHHVFNSSPNSSHHIPSPNSPRYIASTSPSTSRHGQSSSPNASRKTSSSAANPSHHILPSSPNYFLTSSPNSSRQILTSSPNSSRHIQPSSQSSSRHILPSSPSSPGHALSSPPNTCRRNNVREITDRIRSLRNGEDYLSKSDTDTDEDEEMRSFSHKFAYMNSAANFNNVGDFVGKAVHPSSDFKSLTKSSILINSAKEKFSFPDNYRDHRDISNGNLQNSIGANQYSRCVESPSASTKRSKYTRDRRHSSVSLDSQNWHDSPTNEFGLNHLIYLAKSEETGRSSDKIRLHKRWDKQKQNWVLRGSFDKIAREEVMIGEIEEYNTTDPLHSGRNDSIESYDSERFKENNRIWELKRTYLREFRTQNGIVIRYNSFDDVYCAFYENERLRNFKESLDLNSESSSHKENIPDKKEPTFDQNYFDNQNPTTAKIASDNKDILDSKSNFSLKKTYETLIQKPESISKEIASKIVSRTSTIKTENTSKFEPYTVRRIKNLTYSDSIESQYDPPLIQLKKVERYEKLPNRFDDSQSKKESEQSYPQQQSEMNREDKILDQKIEDSSSLESLKIDTLSGSDVKDSEDDCIRDTDITYDVTNGKNREIEACLETCNEETERISPENTHHDVSPESETLKPDHPNNSMASENLTTSRLLDENASRRNSAIVTTLKESPPTATRSRSLSSTPIYLASPNIPPIVIQSDKRARPTTGLMTVAKLKGMTSNWLSTAR